MPNLLQNPRASKHNELNTRAKQPPSEPRSQTETRGEGGTEPSEEPGAVWQVALQVAGKKEEACPCSVPLLPRTVKQRVWEAPEARGIRRGGIFWQDRSRVCWSPEEAELQLLSTWQPVSPLRPGQAGGLFPAGHLRIVTWCCLASLASALLGHEFSAQFFYSG